MAQPVKPQKNSTIDLSAGMVPANGPSHTSHTSNTPNTSDIDLSAGMVPASSQAQSAPPAAATNTPKPPQKGLLSRAWDFAMNGLASPETVTKVLTLGQGDYDQMKAERDYLDPNEGPVHAAIRRGIAGMGTSAADTLSSFTSPSSLALAGAGTIAKVAPAAGTLARTMKAAQTAAGVGFGAQGAKQVYDAATDDSQPFVDRVQKGLLGAGMAASGAAGAMDSAPTGRGALAKKMAEVPSGEKFSREEVNQAARDRGINLDLADATGSKVAKMAKAATQHGLGGSGTFEAANEQNIEALGDWGDEYLDKLSPNSGQAAGSRIQEALKTDLANRKTQAAGDFRDLDQRVGQNSIDGTNTVEAQARQIKSEMGPYYAKHPNLVPKQAYGIIQNLAERPTIPDGKGGMVEAPTHQFSWSELHKLRSDLMDVYRNNTDVTKSQSDAWLQNMVKTIDDTMTQASSGLSPADRAQFRQANEIWEGMKNTYDNPQHPFYHGVRSQFASMTPDMISNKAPEMAREINNTLGSSANDFRRWTAEKILSPDQNGNYDFKNMSGRLKKYSPEYLNALLGPKATTELYKMARIGKTVTNDINPSGSGKLAAKTMEAIGLAHGVVRTLHGDPNGLAEGAAVPAIELGVAKTMNSPKVVDYLTKPGAPKKPWLVSPTTRRVAPGAISGAMASRQRRQQ